MAQVNIGELFPKIYLTRIHLPVTFPPDAPNPSIFFKQKSTIFFWGLRIREKSINPCLPPPLEPPQTTLPKIWVESLGVEINHQSVPPSFPPHTPPFLRPNLGGKKHEKVVVSSQPSFIFTSNQKGKWFPFWRTRIFFKWVGCLKPPGRAGLGWCRTWRSNHLDGPYWLWPCGCQSSVVPWLWAGTLLETGFGRWRCCLVKKKTSGFEDEAGEMFEKKSNGNYCL